MTVYEINAIQLAVMSAHDVMLTICEQENKIHHNKVCGDFREMLADLECMVEALDEIKEGAFIEFEENGNAESDDESTN